MANTAVFGIFSTRAQVEQAVDQLRVAGFRPTDISVLFPENVGTKEFAHEKNTKAPEGAAAGTTSGALVGGIAGALVGMGIPEYEAKRYEGLIKGGGILLSVHTDSHDWTERAREILERTGADDIAATSEAKGDYANADRPSPRPGGMGFTMHSHAHGDHP